MSETAQGRVFIVVDDPDELGVLSDVLRQHGYSVLATSTGRRALRRDYVDRLARGLASVVNVVDPDAIVLGGGVSNLDVLYERVPEAMGQWVFSDTCDTPILRNVHGDSSGVRGAAWLWPAEREGTR